MSLGEKIIRAYHVTYERDGSGWCVASVRGVRGCHTQGRTVDEALRRIRKAMNVFVDDARSAKLADVAPSAQKRHRSPRLEILSRRGVYEIVSALGADLRR